MAIILGEKLKTTFLGIWLGLVEYGLKKIRAQGRAQPKHLDKDDEFVPAQPYLCAMGSTFPRGEDGLPEQFAKK